MTISPLSASVFAPSNSKQPEKSKKERGDGLTFDQFETAFAKGNMKLADVGSQGGVAGADGVLDNNDRIVFTNQYFEHQRAQQAAAAAAQQPPVSNTAPATPARRDLLTFADFQAAFDAGDLSADVGVQGGIGGSDGVLDNNDQIAFINQYFARQHAAAQNPPAQEPPSTQTPARHELLTFAEFQAAFDAGDMSADVGAQGGIGGSDGVLDNNDHVAFINQYFARQHAAAQNPPTQEPPSTQTPARHELLTFAEFQAAFDAGDMSADVGTQGGIGGSDGVLDNNDHVAFINQYFARQHAAAQAAPAPVEVAQTPPAHDITTLAEFQAAFAAGDMSADVGVQGGFGGSDGVLNNNDQIAFINQLFAHQRAERTAATPPATPTTFAEFQKAFDAGDMIADVGSQGGVAGSDGVLNNNDQIAFINQYFANHPSQASAAPTPAAVIPSAKIDRPNTEAEAYLKAKRYEFQQSKFDATEALLKTDKKV